MGLQSIIKSGETKRLILLAGALLLAALTAIPASNVALAQGPAGRRRHPRQRGRGVHRAQGGRAIHCTSHLRPRAGRPLLRREGSRFNAFSEAAETGNAEVLHGLLAADIRERCTVGQLQRSLTDEDPLFPDLDVRDVYVDLEDPTRVLLQVALRAEPDDSLAGLASAFIEVFPFPMIKEDEGWRLSLPGFALAQVEGCPFGDDSDDDAPDPDQPQPMPRPIEPTQAFEPIHLEPPPGATSHESSSSGGAGSFGAALLLETDMTVSATLEYYLQELVEPDWQVQQKTLDEGLATVTWTFRDDLDDPWFGVLLVAPIQENLYRVRLWMGSGGRDRFFIPDRPAVPVPAPSPVPAEAAVPATPPVPPVEITPTTEGR